MAYDRRGSDVFSPTTPHFFKIILEDTLQNDKLQIPKRIVNLCGDSLSSSVILELPCGLRWEVGLTKCDGKVWIDKGWTDFSKFYSLGHGDLLVFKYEGNSQLHVLIFDKSTTEIDYPSDPDRFEKHDIDRQPQELEKEEDDSVEILESFSASCKKREKSELPSSRPQKRTKTGPVGKTQINQSHRRPEEFDFSDKEGGGEKSIPPKWRKSRDLTRLQLTANDKSQAFKRACDFKSKDPFFIVVMQPSYFGVKYAMNLPCPFATKYLGDKRAFVILKVGNGMTWPVMYTFGVYGKNQKAKFEFGWKAFAHDNDLKVGDVCVFVLTKSIGISFDVAIFHENETEKPVVLPVHNNAMFKVGHRGSLSNKLQSPYNMMTKKTCMSTQRRCLKELIVKGKARALEIANHFQTENPFFTFVLQASYSSAKGYFNIPTKFARTYINKNQSDVILRLSDGRCWSVQYKVRQSLRRSFMAEFRDGWTAFAQDNNLRASDVCTFELINGKEICFNVSIVRVADDSNDVALGKECSNPNSFEKHGNDRHPHHGLEKEEETLYSSSPFPKRRNKSPLPCSFPRKRVQTGSDHGEARRDSSHLRSKGKFKMMISEENTCGDVTTRPSTSRDTYEAANKFFSTNPYFQVALLSSHFKPTHSKVHVPVAFARTYFGERTQTVNLQVGGRSWPVKLLTNLSVYRFSRGWAAFASDNSLCPKDVLIFELIKRKSVVLKVSIFKQTGLVNCNSSNEDSKNVLVID